MLASYSCQGSQHSAAAAAAAAAACPLLQSSSVDGPDGNCLGWAARDDSGTLAPYKFSRRQLQPNDVIIKTQVRGFVVRPALPWPCLQRYNAMTL
jgi:cinnamyl-alcohol dehydrogenase